MNVSLRHLAVLVSMMLLTGTVLGQEANDVGRKVEAPAASPDGPAGEEPLPCTVQSGFSGQNTQLGRIFRDALPSTCPGKTYPGNFDAASSFYY